MRSLSSSLPNTISIEPKPKAVPIIKPSFQTVTMSNTYSQDNDVPATGAQVQGQATGSVRSVMDRVILSSEIDFNRRVGSLFFAQAPKGYTLIILYNLVISWSDLWYSCLGRAG